MNCISNPPYNLKWEQPVFAQLQSRFYYGVPPKSNANLAFILTGLDKTNKSAFIMPTCILNSNNQDEKYIIKNLVDGNLIDAIIQCPDKMFESTSISVCIMLLNKNKQTTKTTFIDASKQFEIEKREQKGQFGGSAHENRTYIKEVKVFSDETIEKIIKCIENKEDIDEFAVNKNIDDIKNQNYSLSVQKYVELKDIENITRSYDEIFNDLNKIIREKNNTKIIINEKIAKSLGIYNIEIDKVDLTENNKFYKENFNNEIIKDDYITFSKNANELIIKNNSKDDISDIVRFALKHWSEHIYFLNKKENIYLAELRDKMLPELMSGKLKLD